jgi:hypothetical protein
VDVCEDDLMIVISLDERIAEGDQAVLISSSIV